MTVQAMTLVTTSNLKESTERVSIASICSVARIFASCAPMPAPTRPAISKAATSGPISLKNASDWKTGISAVAPNCTRVLRVCNVMTTPSARPDATTKKKEPTPIS